jgi:hypothetical protein
LAVPGAEFATWHKKESLHGEDPSADPPLLRSLVAEARQTQGYVGFAWRSQEVAMKTKMYETFERKLEEGRVGWVLLWLLGVPIPVLLILFLLRGCT